jgi:hypothetical protein
MPSRATAARDYTEPRYARPSNLRHDQLGQAERQIWLIWELGILCSWLNMVEIFFGIITRQAIRRGTFRNVKDLTNAIGRFIDAYNQRCQPFMWTKDADELLAKIRPSKN